MNTRPKVLLADNHAQVLEIVEQLLAPNFEIVAAVPDGRQALEAALLHQPDIAVLDIRMPELDGFDTLRELRRLNSRSKVVLLTLHQSDAYVRAALSSGAQGYVWKARINSDLISAIDHALAGRLFVPSLTSLVPGEGSSHAVQYHMNDGAFLDEASQFIYATLRSGEPVVIVVAEQTRAGIAQRLKERGLDLAALKARGQYAEFDAVESLSQIMRDGHADPDSMAAIVASLDRFRLSSPRGPQARLTLFGEMAGLLLLDGNVEGAVEIEQTWSRLTRPLPIFTVCSYSLECFRAEGSRVFPSVCAEHGAVNHSLNA